MSISLQIAIAAALAAALLVLALVLLGRRGGAPEPSPRTQGPAPGACPLCSSVLGSGERVRSDILPGGGDRLMRIFGCPHCLAPEGAARRSCPVCGRELPPGAWAMARYFERPGRRHVHVLGCDSCRPAGARKVTI